MKAAVTTEPRAHIEIVDVPEPELRSGEVLVRVRAASVNRLDRAVYDGVALGGVAQFPLTQGIDAAGVIESGSGSMATGLRVAVKPVIACRKCRSCKRNQSADCESGRMFGVHRQGGFAEFLAVPRTNLVVLPEEVTFAEGAAAAHTHAVVLRMMRAAGEIGEDTNLLVTGAGGALGTAAIQLGTAFGARVIAAASSVPKLELADRLGASLLANRSVLDDFPGAILDATDGEGADVVIETTGDPGMISDAYTAMGRGGRVVIVAGLPDTNLSVDINDLYRSRKAVIGSAGSSDRDFKDTYRLLVEHDIHPVIAQRFPLDQTQQAMDAVLNRQRIGKIVIEMGDQQ